MKLFKTKIKMNKQFISVFNYWNKLNYRRILFTQLNKCEISYVETA